MKQRGMLLLLGCMLFGALGVMAAPWGGLTDYVDEQEPKKTGEKYLLSKVLNGQSVWVGLQENEYTTEKYEKLSQLIIDSYNAWFSNTLHHIEKRGREAEFEDILPILRRGIQVQINKIYPLGDNRRFRQEEWERAGGKANDINIIFMPWKMLWKLCGRDTGGCYVHGDDFKPEIYLPANDSFLKIATLGKTNKKKFAIHEIGHSLGLSDQYFQARSRNSDTIYGSTEERATIMQHARHLTCDDADGIINLIDITQGTRRGGDRGWKTLCSKSKEYYIGGMSAGKGPYRITLSKGKQSVALTTYENGKQIAREVYPFAKPDGAVPWQETPAQAVLEKDQHGRTVKASGPNGEIIYYAYLYERVERLVVRDGLVLSLVTQVRLPAKQMMGNMKDYKEMFFGQRGVVCLLKVKTLVKQGYISEYGEGLGENEQFGRYLKRSYNEHGKLIDHEYQEYDPKRQAPSSTRTKGHLASSSRQALEKRIDRQVASAEQEQLESQLDQWAAQTLQEFSRKKQSIGKKS